MKPIKTISTAKEHRTGDIVYTYDAAGNRLSKTGTDGSFIYTYDANARLLSDGKYTYGWDDAAGWSRRRGPRGRGGTSTTASDRRGP